MIDDIIQFKSCFILEAKNLQAPKSKYFQKMKK